MGIETSAAVEGTDHELSEQYCQTKRMFNPVKKKDNSSQNVEPVKENCFRYLFTNVYSSMWSKSKSFYVRTYF